MKKSTLLLFSLFSLTFQQTSLAKDNWGAPITLKDPVSLDAAIANHSEKSDEQVLIKAEVGKVCEKKGCWMTLKSEKTNTRVTFKDYGFFVPPHLLNKTVLVQGKLKTHTMSLSEAKHFASDAGKDPKRIKSPVKEFRVVSTGVQLLK